MWPCPDQLSQHTHRWDRWHPSLLGFSHRPPSSFWRILGSKGGKGVCCWGSGIQLDKVKKKHKKPQLFKGLLFSVSPPFTALQALKDRLLCPPGLAQFLPHGVL